MKYSDGQEIKVGDEVELWKGSFGRVVCSLDTSEYTRAYSEAEWGYLKTGILVESVEVGLIHVLKQEHRDSIRLVHRETD